MSDETRRLANEFFEAFGRRDVDTLMQIVSEDIVEDLPGVGIVSGLEDERAFFTGLFGSFPDLTTEVTRITIDGRVAAIEWKRWGTFTGAPWQGLPASGRAFESSGATFVEVDDGRFTKTGRAFDNPEAMHLQVIDGQIVRMHLYEDTAMVNDAWLDT